MTYRLCPSTNNKCLLTRVPSFPTVLYVLCLQSRLKIFLTLTKVLNLPVGVSYDRGIPFFGENVFCKAGLLNPKIVGE